MKKLLVLLGFIFIGIGAIGIILPILPTTPFLLLATFCFAKGSKKFHKWFISTKIYKKYLDSFVQNKAMTIKMKLSILISASAMLIAAFIFAGNLYIRISIGTLIAIKYYYFIFRIKTIDNKKSIELNKVENKIIQDKETITDE